MVTERRRLRTDVEECGDLIGELAPRRQAGGHLDHRAAHAPYVRLPTVANLLDHLGRHPERRSLQAE